MLQRFVVLTALTLAFAVPGAQAADFNVTTGAEFTAALGTAASNGTADRILLAAGTYTGPFSYNGTEDLEVLGAGAGSTTIDQTTGGAGLLLQNAAPTYHVADLGFTLGSAANQGLRIAGPGIVERIQTIAAAGFQGQTVWLLHSGLTLQHAALSQPGATLASLVHVTTSGPVTIQDSTFAGGGAQ